MKRLLHYLHDYKKECVLAPLFKMLEAVFELTVPLVVARMIDRESQAVLLSRSSVRSVF